MRAAAVKTDIIDADAHVVENEHAWDYLDAADKKYRPTLMTSPEDGKRQFWVPDIISSPGDHNLVIGTDYGHGDTSSELNAIARFKAIKGLSEPVKRKILSDNPRRLYGI